MVGPKATFRATGVTIACTDLARSIGFYEQVLGAVPEPRDGYGCPWFNLGPLSINLMHNATEPSPARMSVHPMAMLWLVTDDVAAASQRLARFGVEVLQPSDGQFMVVADPDGIVIEVWQAKSDGGV